MVNQECQTLISDLPAFSPKTNQLVNGTHNSRVADPLSWSSNPLEPTYSVTTNQHNEDADDNDPLYAVPNHPRTKTQINQQNEKPPKTYYSLQRRANNNSSSSPPLHNTSIETNSSSVAALNSSKCSSPCSVPNTFRNYNLERSQSLRVSRKSQRSISSSSKGGSLR